MNTKANTWTMCALTLAVLMAGSASLNAQERSPSWTLTPMYIFQGLEDGSNPNEVILDAAGNLYGSAQYGGDIDNCEAPYGCGAIFKIDARGHESVLYAFGFSPSDGNQPYGGVFRDSSGIYGTTTFGGTNGAGTVFRLSPPPRACTTAICPWSESVLYSFGSGMFDTGPAADLIRGANGNLYSTSASGGTGPCNDGCGTVFEVDAHGNVSVVYNFQGPPADGREQGYLSTSLLLGADGSLYGTTPAGGTSDAGTVFKLTPSGSGWTESVIYNFTGGADGFIPQQGLVADAQGNLFGTTSLGGGAANAGVVFKLTPNGGSWTQSVIHTFTGPPDGAHPLSGTGLLRDNQGNLYGTTFGGGSEAGNCGSYGCGTVFKLTPSGSGWTESILWSFTDGPDGALPGGTLAMDGQGNLYGAALFGGGYLDNPNCTGLAAPGCGVIFKLTP